MSISRVLIANRGEIAVRVIRACRALGKQAVVAVSEADRDTLAARLADRAVCVGPAAPGRSYLNIPALVTAAVGTGCDALHPGYGFLAESAELAEACARAGVTFIGPRPEHIRSMGDKLAARALARSGGVPLLPGSEGVADAAEAERVAREIGFPVLLKAAAGGGGRGMKVVSDPAGLRAAFETATAEVRAAFGDPTVYLERYIANARHIEVQVMGDRHGRVVHLGERDCSVQRRYQKVVEESPALLPEATRRRIRETAAGLARRIGYESAGTLEFVLDGDTDEFFFLEMNTRIQVEHPVTEEVTGVDLVQAQIRVAEGEPLPFRQEDVALRGHAIEFRVNAESPEKGFRPSPGRIERWRPPEGPGIRVDSHCYAGYTVPVFYDSLLAKLIVRGDGREDALERARGALDRFEVSGIETNLAFLGRLARHPAFAAGRVNTRFVESLLAAGA